ncbi:MAG: SDR family oxidoreductase [Actinobacteria bacterium]|nr:MAG: SDR family oxidoreductase [Actinomycetota bacterium]
MRLRPRESSPRRPLRGPGRVALERQPNRAGGLAYPRRMTDQELAGRVALVTGGGRGIGANIARELADAGARVAASARTLEQVEEVARETAGLAVVADVTDRAAVEAMVDRVESELGPIDLLVANAGRNVREERAWEVEPRDWWNVFEVNVLGVYLCCRAVIPGMLERGRGRIVITGSGAAYLPHSGSTAYPASKAAVWRFGNVLAEQLAGRIPVFVISPGLVKTEMTKRAPDDAPWTPPELAPRLVRTLASGRADALTGRYIHAEHDDVEELIRRADEIREHDLNAIRLQR